MKVLRKKVKGEFYFMFLAMAVPVFILMMVIAYDFGNFLIMRSMTRSFADSVALSAAASVDMGGSNPVSRTGGTEKGYGYTLNRNWSDRRSRLLLAESLAEGQTPVVQKRMTFSISQLQVNGKEARATVTGTYTPVWSFLTGKGSFQTMSSANSKAATGIVGEIN